MPVLAQSALLVLKLDSFSSGVFCYGYFVGTWTVFRESLPVIRTSLLSQAPHYSERVRLRRTASYWTPSKFETDFLSTSAVYPSCKTRGFDSKAHVLVTSSTVEAPLFSL